MAKKGVIKARRKGFELQLSELWGNKNNLSAQFQFQLFGFETKFIPCFFLKIFTLYVFFRFFGNSSYHEIIVSQEPKMA